MATEINTILLTQGYVAIVSKLDYKKLKKHKWAITRSAGVNRKLGEPYACTKIEGKKVYMHRFIMGGPKGLIVDHINRQTLDNRRENLRIVTHSENMKNRESWAKNKRKK